MTATGLARQTVMTLLLLGVAVATLFGSTGPVAGRSDVVGTDVGWWEIELVARKFLLSAQTSVRVQRVSADTTELTPVQPLSPPGLMPSGPELDVLTVTSVLPFGRRERVVTWLDPATGAALQTEKTRTGRGPYWKLQRYHRGGYTEWRAAPANDTEEASDPRGWSHRQVKEVPCTGRLSPDEAVSDSYALLYQVAAARLDRGSHELVLVLCSDQHLVEVRFRPGPVLKEKVSFEESWPGGRRHRGGHIRVRRIFGTARWLGKKQPDSEPETGMMGMRGPLEILVEEGTGLPVEVRGRAQGIGQLVVRLKRVIWRQPPS